jgi:PAS domain-containing protein
MLVNGISDARSDSPRRLLISASMAPNFLQMARKLGHNHITHEFREEDSILVMEPATQKCLAAALPDAMVVSSDAPIVSADGGENPSPAWSSTRPLPSYLNNAGDGIYVLDEETGRILDANSRGAQMLGYSRDELLQLSPADIEQRHSPDAILRSLRMRTKASCPPRGCTGGRTDRHSLSKSV